VALPINRLGREKRDERGFSFQIDLSEANLEFDTRLKFKVERREKKKGKREIFHFAVYRELAVFLKP